MKHVAIILCLFYGPAHAGVKDVVEHDIIPGFAAFAQSTAEFADVANATCDRVALATAYPAVMTAWIQVQHWHIGQVLVAPVWRQVQRVILNVKYVKFIVWDSIGRQPLGSPLGFS